MAPALEVADIFRRHGAAFRQVHAGHLGCVERRIMNAITACRTAALGGHVEQCDDCGATRIAYNSCRNRHCPKCQGLARVQWLADRQAELLPVPYFHVVFTLPAPVGEIAFQNKAAVYAILFRVAAKTANRSEDNFASGCICVAWMVNNGQGRFNGVLVGAGRAYTFIFRRDDTVALAGSFLECSAISDLDCASDLSHGTYLFQP
jgi:hypothetical protein